MDMNLPDDWDSYGRVCRGCRKAYHESEGGCFECPPGTKFCARCDEPFIDEDDIRSVCDSCATYSTYEVTFKVTAAHDVVCADDLMELVHSILIDLKPHAEYDEFSLSAKEMPDDQETT